MYGVILSILLTASLSLAWERCIGDSVNIRKAIDNARPHTGKVYSVKLYLKKKTGECLYSVRGVNGYATVDAKTGEILRFTKRRR